MTLIREYSRRARMWRVWDDNGRAFIQRFVNGKLDQAWHSPDRTALEWISLQRWAV